jgi:hypothetical protein
MRITDTSEASTNAQYCREFLGEAVEDVLGHYDWHCCRRRARLAPDAEKPAFGFSRQFPLPADCIRIISVGTEGLRDAVPYAVENRFIFSDADTLEIVYLELPADPNGLPAPLRKAVYTTLTQLLTIPLTSSEELAARVSVEQQLALKRAREWDAAQEYDPSAEGERWWEEARR